MSAVFVQQRLRAVLSGIAPVFDTVPVEAPAPYLTIGPDLSSDWSTKTNAGREHRVSIGVWDDGPGVARCKALLAEIEAAVMPLTGAAGGQRIASVLFLRSFTNRDPDGWSHGVAEFRIRTEEI